MSVNNRWMVSSRYDFQAHQQRSQRRCFTQTALLWVEVLPDWSPSILDLSSALPVLSPALPDLSPALPGISPALPGAPRLLDGTPRLVAGAPRCSQVHPKFSPVLRGVPKPLTITPMVLLYQSSGIAVTLKASRNALLGSETPKIDASKFALHILTGTPGGFQWLKFILLKPRAMRCSTILNPTWRYELERWVIQLERLLKVTIQYSKLWVPKYWLYSYKQKNQICETLDAYLWSWIQGHIAKTDRVRLISVTIWCGSLRCSVLSPHNNCWHWVGAQL